MYNILCLLLLLTTLLGCQQESSRSSATANDIPKVTLKKLDELKKHMTEADYLKIMGPYDGKGGSGFIIYYHKLDANLRLMSGFSNIGLRYSYIIDNNGNIQKVLIAE